MPKTKSKKSLPVFIKIFYILSVITLILALILVLIVIIQDPEKIYKNFPTNQQYQQIKETNDYYSIQYLIENQFVQAIYESSFETVYISSMSSNYQNNHDLEEFQRSTKPIAAFLELPNVKIMSQKINGQNANIVTELSEPNKSIKINFDLVLEDGIWYIDSFRYE